MQTLLDKVGIQKLLKKIEILSLPYEKLKDENKFNIFSILRKNHDEVHLHSKFIYELLNPKGTHSEGDKFLKLFLETIEIQDFEVKHVQVEKEHRHIDILITNRRKQAIIIENKLRAGDQDRQLERYYEKIKDQHYKEIWLVYLSLRDEGPSDNSLGNLSKEIKKEYLITISYSRHISEWLEKCLWESIKKPILRETIIQYDNLVKEITGNTMSNEQGKEVYDLLKERNNIDNAYTIISNWDHVRWFLERDFWEDLQKTIPKEYEISNAQRWSPKALDGVIHNGGKDPWYGIVFELFSKDKDIFYLSIERGWDNLYYGITIDYNEESDSTEKRNEYAEFTAKLNEFTDFPKNKNGWLGRNEFEPRINFEIFTPETLALIDENHRKKHLEIMWAEIKEFIANVEKVKAEVFGNST